MVKRRDFLKSTLLAAGASMVTPVRIFASSPNLAADYFQLHPFVESNPEAVFIMLTSVEQKTDASTIKSAAETFAGSLFLPASEGDGAIPITNKMVFKPNITCRNKYQDYLGTEEEKLEASMGIITDSNFMEGMIESFKTLGMNGDQIYMRERSCPDHWEKGGYVSMATRTGANLKNLAGNVSNDQLAPEDVNWVDLPEGMWFRKIPYLAPVNSPDSYLINVSKYKSHTVGGLTLCGKNLQGSIAYPYVQHCRPLEMDFKEKSPDHLNPNRIIDIALSYSNHKDVIPRWDKPGSTTSYNPKCGINQETWVHRCIDNHMASNVGLHVIEGIYGRDGDGFSFGPNTVNGKAGMAKDYMTNMIIFGKNAFHVDVIGHWLGGHEPGNIGLFHIAIERGVATHMNPANIPVYLWNEDGTSEMKSLDTFQRFELKSDYLTRDYDGQTEETYHLMNEEFDYSTSDPSGTSGTQDKPYSFILKQNYPNPFREETNIEFYLPKPGIVKLEVFDSRGQCINVLKKGRLQQGAHHAIWNTGKTPSGNYFYRLWFDGYVETKHMQLIK